MLSNVDWSAVAAGLSAIAALAAATAAFRTPLSAERLAAAFQTAAADRERKLDCLRRVAAYRAVPPSPEWIAALNEIAVTFNDKPDVMSALTKFENGIQKRGGHDNEDLIRLIETMMVTLGLQTEKIDREFFLRPFTANRTVTAPFSQQATNLVLPATLLDVPERADALQAITGILMRELSSVGIHTGLAGAARGYQGENLLFELQMPSVAARALIQICPPPVPFPRSPSS